MYLYTADEGGLNLISMMVESFAFSALTRLGSRRGIRPVKTECSGAGVVISLQLGADLHMAQLMPLPLTVSYFQIGFTFLVPAHPGSPGKRAVKRVRVCVPMFSLTRRIDIYNKFRNILLFVKESTSQGQIYSWKISPMSLLCNITNFLA